jgi:hypothetical protein
MHRLSSFTFLEAVGRRLWHNYCWIFFIHVTSYVDKLLIHPTPISSVDEFFAAGDDRPRAGERASGERMCAADRRTGLATEVCEAGAPRYWTDFGPARC